MSTTEWKDSEGTQCRKCRKTTVKYRIWTSSDEAHEDEAYMCTSCGASWWIDGPDY